MGLKIITGDIFDCKADALVFPASNAPVKYGLLDEQVYQRAGEAELLEARRRIGRLSDGRPAVTESFGLKEKYKYLIHIPVPEFKLQAGDRSLLPHNYRQLKDCYTNSLELIKKNKLTSVVFPLLGTGMSGHPYNRTKDMVVRLINIYVRKNPEINITLVEYEHHEKYKKLVQLIKQAKEVEKYNLSGWHINTNSVIGGQISNFGNLFRADIDMIRSQYRKERQELCEEMKIKHPKMSKERICQEVDDEIYKEIFSRNKKTTNDDLAVKLHLYNGSDVSKLKNLATKKGVPYDFATGFLNNRERVIELAQALELCADDFCRLVWSRGHAFPEKDSEYRILSEIKEKNFEKVDKEKLNNDYEEEMNM